MSIVGKVQMLLGAEFNFGPSSKPKVPTTIRVWYDRNSQSWVLSIEDDEAFEAAPAVYLGNKTQVPVNIELIKHEFPTIKKVIRDK